MRNIFKALAVAALFAPTAVFAAEPVQRFTHNGITYRYTVTTDAKGRQVITGRQAAGAAFRLVVSGDKVEGVSGGQPVSFRAPRGGAVVLAAR